MVDHGVVWFRKDLRLVDNPAWNAAVSKCRRITALFVVDPAIVEPAGPYRLAQLSAHLRALDEELASAGGQLWLRRGDPASVVPHVVGEVEAGALYANADAAPGSRRRDKRVHQALASTPAARHHRNEPVPFHTYWGTLVLPPLSVTTNDGGVSKVFTPFYKRWRDTPWDAWPERNPLAEDTPQVTRPPSQAAWGAGETMAIDNLHHAGDVPHHSGGSQAALGRLGAAVQRAPRYRDERDRPDLATTTELSADLHYGTLSPRRAASALGHATGGSDSEGPPADAVEGGAAIVRQLAWRDWYAHLLWAHPHLTDRAMRSEYDRLPWQNDPDEFDAWCQGRTGFPIVDAGMRQLAASCSSTGAWAKPTFAACSSTVTPSKMSATGSGWPAPAPMRRPTFGSSTRRPRPRSSIPAASSFDPGCPSWPVCHRSGSIAHRRPRPGCWPMPGLSWGRPIPCR